jgi:hypothetical protein
LKYREVATAKLLLGIHPDIAEASSARENSSKKPWAIY